jgi:hydroxymethylpyrimidine pyrophosphatase-like HAD family hydrolase
VSLAVITARPRRDVDAAVSSGVPDSAYWAYSNGAVIHAPGAAVPARVLGFAADQATRIAVAVRAADPAWSCALDLVDRTVTVVPFPSEESAHWSHVVRCASVEEITLPDRVPKVLVRTGTACDATVVEAVQRVMGPDVVATASGRAYVELVPPGTGKSEALRWLCADLGVEPADAVAVGDGLNDLGMLRLAGLAAAPANAPAEVRHAADIVLPSNDENAVAVLVDALLGDGTLSSRRTRSPLPLTSLKE